MSKSRLNLSLLCLMAIHFLTANISAQSEQLQITPLKTLLKYHASPWFGEQVREMWVEPGIRALLNASGDFNPAWPTRLIIYATPNGNTAEQTLGSAIATGIDWHFDIQHVAAQTRRLREISPQENVILACVEAEGLSWPAWRQQHADNAARILSLVEILRNDLPNAATVRVTIMGHSGGGSFIFGFINSADAIPDYVDGIGFLDANYSYSDGPERHGDKLLQWLKTPTHRLVVIAYDDRNIMLDGKKVVGPTGGTFRASQRMLERFQKEIKLNETTENSLQTYHGLDGQLLFHTHLNPENKILHTALVGEMNGFLEAVTQGTPQANLWGTFLNERAYTKWEQPPAMIPERTQNAIGGAEFIAHIADFDAQKREQAIAAEICRGNIPPFLRKFVNVSLNFKDEAGQEHQAIYQVMPDYLAIGSDEDFVRFPMTPQTAQLVADAFGCSLPTRKLVDAIYQQAVVKLEPRPLTEEREATKTFGEHNGIIENQRAGQALGLLVSGIKKDIVITNILTAKPNRVAIYGWHKLDGSPIQPLTTVHRDTYVDYSHGVRLVQRAVIVDGKKRDVRALFHSKQLCPLISDEGTIEVVTY